MRKEIENNSLIWKILLICLVICIIVFRIVLMKKWLIHYFDDDQALMWDATVTYAHLKFPEPYFWGQSYGYMLESLIAVPFYWMKIPLYIALPTAAIINSLMAYVFIAYILAKDNHIKTACIVIASFLLMSWRWDILVSVPRCFISGMSLAVISSIWMNRTKSVIKAGIYSFLCTIAFIMTNSALVIIAIGYLDFLLNVKREIKKVKTVLTGGIAGLLIYFLAKSFYVINPEYNLHAAPTLALSKDVLFSNIIRFTVILSDFSFLNHGILILVAFFMVILCSVIFQHWKIFILLCANMFLMFVMLSMKKTADYSDNSVTFSQTRMFLCWTYSLLPIVYYWKMSDISFHYYCRVFRVFKAKPSQLFICMILLIIVVTANVIKLDQLDADVKSEYSKLRNGYAANTYKVSDIILLCKDIDRMAELSHADTIITGDRRALSYAFDALYFGKYTVYNCVYDRRTWNYIALKQKEERCCLYIDGVTNDPLHYSVINFDKNDNIIQYFEDKYSYYRRPV